MGIFGFSLIPTPLYIDPAATSILITSISGIAIAVGATAVILWRKAKKKVSTALHIDENAGKEVEEELVVNAPEAVAEEAPAESSDTEN